MAGGSSILIYTCALRMKKRKPLYEKDECACARLVRTVKCARKSVMRSMHGGTDEWCARVRVRSDHGWELVWTGAGGIALHAMR